MEKTLLIDELHAQITATQERLVAATEADDEYEVARQRARLEDLIELADRNGFDVDLWVDRSLLAN
jgi:hypothetical protein